MIKGEKIRFDIHNILYSIYKFNKTLNNPSIKKIISRHKQKDISLLNNVTLNSMRLHLQVTKIIKKYIKKKLRDHEKILLVSSITQIVFLDFKEYAVINCSVEIAKKLKIYHGLINSSLKKISENKKMLRQTKIEFNDLPLWFQNKTKSLTRYEKYSFLENYVKEPNIHVVFKNEEKLKEFEEDIFKTSSVSGFLKIKKKIEEIESFKKGYWWIQDFSSFFPLHNLKIKNKKLKFLDTCAAPGGKSFQLLSKKLNLVSNDISSSRIKTLKENLDRLNFNSKVVNKDFTQFNEDQKYDFIIVDAPCSAIGTIRKNPEIFFKNKTPDFEILNSIQEKMLNKASLLLKSNGIILYMVCSFLKNETEDQINNFLSRKSDFELYEFKLIKENIEYLKLIKKNFMHTLPDNIFNYNIDGYFAAYLKKII
tara:strand:+ start:1067 stop:2335 length:1269 start_codon:yes stop_codon:yes gene_type:complete